MLYLVALGLVLCQSAHIDVKPLRSSLLEPELRYDSKDIPHTMPFEQWHRLFEKGYGAEEIDYRRGVYEKRVEYIKAFNAENKKMKLGVNQFSALTLEEFSKTYLRPMNNTKRPPRRERRLNIENVPSSYDWRTQGCVTNVKNQGQCGSCWSFGTSGSLEGAWCIKYGNLTSLSEQQMVDCDKTDMGCHGGLPDNAFQYIQQNGGLDSEKDYPYTAEDGVCNTNQEKRHVATVNGYTDVPADNEEAMIEAIFHGPVAVGIQANLENFQSYRSGVMTTNCPVPAQIDHAVLAVGYTEDAYIVKNSWGTTWGMSGYIQMARGVSGEGICGINHMASYPHAGEPPHPTPPNPGKAYENPFTVVNCGRNEANLSLSLTGGVNGAICAPTCNAHTDCPNPPANTLATSACVFKDGSSGNQYCGLTCQPSQYNACDPSIGLKCLQSSQAGQSFCAYQYNPTPPSGIYQNPFTGSCSSNENVIYYDEARSIGICSPTCSDTCQLPPGTADISAYCWTDYTHQQQTSCMLLCITPGDYCDRSTGLVCVKADSTYGSLPVCAYQAQIEK